MVDTEIIRTVFGVIGNVISFGLFVLSVPTFCRILKNKSVKGVKPEYHLAAAINCLFWAFYGIPFYPRNILVLTAHGIGLAIQLPYLIIILLYANNNKQRIWVGGVFLIELVISLVIGSLIRLAPYTVKTTRSKLVAASCFISSTMVGAAEVLYMMEMIGTKSVECVEIRILWGKTLYALCWIIYGSLKYDPDFYFMALQVIAFALGVSQLKLYQYVYYKNAAKSAANKKVATAEVQVQGMGTGADKLVIAGMGTGADKLVIAGMGTGADKKLARAGMGTGAGKKLAIDPLQLQENGTA